MDQRPYPGPPPIFHIRIMSLFCLLATTDLVMFMLAYQSIMQNDIGATILFANEVGTALFQIFEVNPQLVCHPCCKRMECIFKVQPHGLRAAARINPRRCRCSALGGKE